MAKTMAEVFAALTKITDPDPGGVLSVGRDVVQRCKLTIH